MKVNSIRILIPISLMIAGFISSSCSPSQAQTLGTQRVSVASNGSQANKHSKQPSISADGHFVAFASDATDLVKDDENGVTDIFVRDLVKNKTTRVSVSSKGKEGDRASYWPYISQDGQYVTFTSEATNLVDGDKNGGSDVFIYDRITGNTELISISIDGKPANDLSFWSSISADGQYVVFMSNATNLVSSDLNDSWDVFLRDREASATRLVSFGYDGSQANSQSEYPIISADGGSIAFASDATNIVSGDSNGYRDVFVYYRDAGKAIRVSVATDGTQANEGTQALVISISADGRLVAFPSLASNLITNDTNNVWDIFVHDRVTGETSRVSVSSDGSQADAGSYGVSISPDGRYVTFGSNATNLVANDTNQVMDTFIHDRQTGTTERISLADDGTQGDVGSGYTLIVSSGVDIAYGAFISKDGGRVVYMSNATNLVANDTNGEQDIFIYTR